MSLLPGESVVIYYNSIVPSSLAVPAPNPAKIPYKKSVDRTSGKTWLENCLSDVAVKEADGRYTLLPEDVDLRCAMKEVLPAHPVCDINCVKYITNGTQAPGGDITVTLGIQNLGTAPMYPQFLDLLPPQLDYVDRSMVFRTTLPDYGPPTYPDSGDADVEAIRDYAGTGRTLVRVTWPDSSVLAPDGLPVSSGVYVIEFKARVQGGHPSGSYENQVVFGDGKDAGPLCTPNRQVKDVHDLDGDGRTDDYQCAATANFTIAPLGGAEIIKKVKGQDDATFQAPPSVGHTSPSGAAQWQITLRNSGSTDLDQAVAYEILPYVGDTAVGPTIEPRLSEWQTLLTGVQLPADVSVEYSTSVNPCRGEVMSQGGALTDGPAGCINDWTATAPTDLKTVRALRFVVNDTTFGAGETKVVTLDVVAPANATGITWNTASIAARTALSGWLQPAAAPKVGLVVPIDLELGKTIISADPHAIGGKVHYRLNLTNKGPGLATEVQVTDQLPAGLTLVSATPSKGTYAVATGLWDIGTVAKDEALTLDIVATINNTAVTGLTNFAQVTRAHQLDIDSIPNNGVIDTRHEDDEAQVPLTLVANTPSVLIVKSTNGFDANTTPGPMIATGAAVNWTYVVTNTGTVPLINLAVTDDKGVTVTCPKTRLEANDGAAGGLDEMTCTASGTATAGQYANIGTVVGTAADGDGNVLGAAGAVTDDDPSHYFGASPSIGIVKKINGDDAESAPGVTTTYPGTMTTTFVVTNTGNVPLSTVTVSDDVLGAISCPKSDLIAAESMTCTLVTATPAPGVQHHDVATASGQPPTLANGTVPARVTATNGAYAHSTAAPSVTILKKVNDDDAETSPGPEVLTGTTMNFTFFVHNTGNTTLSPVVVSDDVIPASAITCPESSLARGESMTCTATLAAPAPGVTHHDVATVTGTPATPDGTAIPGQGNVTDTDQAYAHAVQPGLHIVKMINGADADVPRGVAVPKDSTMNVTFFVANTGSMRLDPVTVTDDTIAAAAITCPAMSLAANDDAPGGLDEMTCTATLAAPAAGVQHKNTATVEGQPLLNGVPSGEKLVDTNPAHAWVAQPGVSIVKKINTDDANTSPGVSLPRLSSMAITFEVANEGNTLLTGVTVTDDKIATSAITCPRNTLAPKGTLGDTMTCTATLPAPEPGVQHQDTGAVTGTPAQDNGTPIAGVGTVSDDDTAYAHVVATPKVSIIKKINGDDAEKAPGVQVDPVAPMSVTFEVSNDGNTPLNPVVVTDDTISADAITCPFTSLGVGGSMTCTASLAAPTMATKGLHHNIATVTGTPATLAGTSIGLANVTGTNGAHAWAALPAVSIVKSINGDDADTAPGVEVKAKESMAITFKVTNTGNLTLDPIVVTDTDLPADAITCPKTALKPGEDTTCTATLTGPAAGVVHHDLATVKGTPIDPATGEPAVDAVTGAPLPPATATNPAYAYAPAHASVTVIKRINGDDANTAPGVEVKPGSTMQITFEVTNHGNVRLDSVKVTDTDLPDSAIDCPATTLGVGESMTCTAELAAPAAGSLHTDTATVTGNPVTEDGGPAVGPSGAPLEPVTASDDANAHAVAAPSGSTDDGGLAYTGANILGTVLLGLFLIFVGGGLARRGRRAA